MGKHPSVCKLLRGISRQRPPTSKYILFWDVERVLNKFRIMQDNKDLPLKELSFKTITLLRLIAPKRGSELTKLDLEKVGKSDTTYTFQLTKPVKHFKQGKRNETLNSKAMNQTENSAPKTPWTSTLRRLSERNRAPQNYSLALLAETLP